MEQIRPTTELTTRQVMDRWEPLYVFRELLRGLDRVEGLMATLYEDGFVIWTIVNGADEALRKQIYELEWALMECFPRLGFDFNLLEREGRPLHDLVTVEHMDLYLRLGD